MGAVPNLRGNVGGFGSPKPLEDRRDIENICVVEVARALQELGKLSALWPQSEMRLEFLYNPQGEHAVPRGQQVLDSHSRTDRFNPEQAVRKGAD
jgi:hypothetical protein